MTPPPVSTLSRIHYGAGGAGEAIKNIALNVFALFYYTQVLECDPLLIGIAGGFALVVDAFTDPLIAAFSDRTKPGRLGRRHPYMLASVVPVGLAMYLLFNPPGDLSEVGLAWWFFISVVTLRVAQTFFTIPHLALGGELSTDYHERTGIMRYHVYAYWFGGAMCHTLGLRLFFDGQDGMRDAAAYPLFGLTWGILMALTFAWTAFGTMNRIGHLVQAARQAVQDTGTMLHDIASVLRNKNYQALLLGVVFMGMSTGTNDALTSHLVNYYWQLTAAEYSLYGVASGVGFLGAFVFAPMLTRRFGKRLLLLVGVASKGIFIGVPIWLHMAGLFPAVNSPALLPTILMCVLGYYLTQALLLVTIASVLADIADEVYLDTRKRQEGVVYAARSLFGKISTGFGLLAAGLLLSAIAFPLGADVIPCADPTSNPQCLPAADMRNLGLLVALAVPVPAFIALFFYGKYSGTAESQAAVREAIEKRDKAEASV